MSTIHISIPLENAPTAGPSRFSTPSCDVLASWTDLTASYRAAKRIVVVCGAGVSTAANIPDFRGSAGLFSAQGYASGTGKGKGKAAIKDLFHVKSLISPTLLAAHQALITELASLAFAAEPTRFHRWLRSMDNGKRLLRVYTQNIDGLEEKAGLRYGVPSKPSPSSRAKRKLSISNLYSSLPTAVESATHSDYLTPRVVPLHGTISTLHCTLCHQATPLLPHLPLPSTPVPCASCHLNSTIRHALSERSRRSGHLRPSIVLYGEEHHQGDLIGSAVERDIKGDGGKLKEGKVDFLVVAGTSLAIPGVKRMVKEMAKAARAARSVRAKGKDASVNGGVRTVLVNDEMPKNPSEWAGVFDLWVQGDIQEVIKLLEEEQHATPSDKTAAKIKSTSKAGSKKPKEPAPSTPRKCKPSITLPPTPTSKTKTTPSKRRLSTSTPRRNVQAENGLPTPRATPPSSSKRKRMADPGTPSKKPKATHSTPAGIRLLTPPLDD